jgi:hypothetical protein
MATNVRVVFKDTKEKLKHARSIAKQLVKVTSIVNNMDEIHDLLNTHATHYSSIVCVVRDWHMIIEASDIFSTLNLILENLLIDLSDEATEVIALYHTFVPEDLERLIDVDKAALSVLNMKTQATNSCRNSIIELFEMLDIVFKKLKSGNIDDDVLNLHTYIVHRYKNIEIPSRLMIDTSYESSVDENSFISDDTAEPTSTTCDN